MHRYFKFFFILIPTIFSLISLATAAFVWIKFSNKDIKIIETIDEDKNSIYDKLQIFPRINKFDFYDDLRIFGNEIIIDKNMIAKIISFVINKAQIPNGNIEYSYYQKNLQELKLTFAWSFYKNVKNLENINNNSKTPNSKTKSDLRYTYFFEVI